MDRKKQRMDAWSTYLSDKSEFNLGALLWTYKPMIAYIARERFKCQYPHISQSDIISEGMIGAWQAVRDYDVTKIRGVDAWVALCAKRKMINFTSKAQHRRMETLEEWTVESMEDDFSFIEFNEAISILTAKEKLIILLRHKYEWRLMDIAKLLKCSKVTVLNTEKSAFRKLSGMDEDTALKAAAG